MAQKKQKKQQEQKKTVFEIGILARVTWNLHSLNNEGTLGNVTEPRVVVLADGTKTDGVSGEMLKHIHAFWCWVEQFQQGNLCSACKILDPRRADRDRQQQPGSWRGQNNELYEKAVQQCVLCDLHGFLVQKPPISRSSTAEFGWAVALRTQSHRDIHTHARHFMGERGQPAAPEEPERREGEPHAQMLYHRPTRSGVYALVTLYQPWRIGLNEVNYTYAVNNGEQFARYQLGLRAYENLFKRPDGAMTSTRLPHVEAIEGIVLVATRPVPVPLPSPIRDDYVQRAEELASLQDIEAKPFSDLVSLAKVLRELRSYVPFRLQRAQGR